MYNSSILAFLFFALAGRALAFNLTITIPTGTVNISSSDMLTIPDSAAKTACASNCTTAVSALQSCGDDASCLCSDDTVKAIVNCEQCMLTNLIETNKPYPDLKTGNNAMMTAYGTACKAEANVTIDPAVLALQLPADWEGPFVSVFPTAVGAIVATVGGLLGIGLITIVNTM